MTNAKRHPNFLYRHYLFVVVVVGFFFVGGGITGMVTSNGGGTSDSGTTTLSNPNLGAVKGTVQFVIKDGEIVISTDKGAGHRIYFSKNGQTITDYALIKSFTDPTFNGTLTGVDADTGSACSSSTYITDLYYYDENNDGIKQSSEKEVYSIVTDSNGCFAAKVKNGAWDIYG